MANQLENLCEERGIKVEFISHKFIDDASESKYNKPVIKVHKIFKQCPMKVATAVIEIYTGEGYIPDCIEIIEGYLVQKFGSVGIRIQPPKVIKTMPVNKPVSIEYKGNEGKHYSREEDYYNKKDNYYGDEENLYGRKDNRYNKEENYYSSEENHYDKKENLYESEETNYSSEKSQYGREENHYSKEEQYIEMEISSIDVTNMKGIQRKLNNNEILMGKEQDILELDIVVAPPTT